MLDSAEYIAINSKAGTLVHLMHSDVQRSNATKKLWRTPTTRCPVGTTAAARFDDDGVTARYQAPGRAQ
jgi:hypothetical protein